MIFILLPFVILISFFVFRALRHYQGIRSITIYNTFFVFSMSGILSVILFMSFTTPFSKEFSKDGNSLSTIIRNKVSDVESYDKSYDLYSNKNGGEFDYIFQKSSEYEYNLLKSPLYAENNIAEANIYSTSNYPFGKYSFQQIMKNNVKINVIKNDEEQKIVKHQKNMVPSDTYKRWLLLEDSEDIITYDFYITSETLSYINK